MLKYPPPYHNYNQTVVDGFVDAIMRVKELRAEVAAYQSCIERAITNSTLYGKSENKFFVNNAKEGIEFALYRIYTLVCKWGKDILIEDGDSVVPYAVFFEINDMGKRCNEMETEDMFGVRAMEADETCVEILKGMIRGKQFGYQIVRL